MKLIFLALLCTIVVVAVLLGLLFVIEHYPHCFIIAICVVGFISIFMLIYSFIKDI
jgi:hypothetical protein